jgi:hypothetical protein
LKAIIGTRGGDRMQLESGRYHNVLLNNNEVDEYETGFDNIAELLVSSGGSDISKQCKVLFSFNKEALIGFGNEAIRLAYRFQEYNHKHVDALGVPQASQSMGFFLTPESPDFVLGCKCFDHLNKDEINRINTNSKNLKDTNSLKVEYLIDLEFDNDFFEEHNIGFDNVAKIKVLKDEQDISNQCTFVILNLSKSALIGLGTELLRLAHNFEKDRNYYIVPMGNKNFNSKLGFYLTEKSSFMSICCSKLNNVFYYDKNFLKR